MPCPPPDGHELNQLDNSCTDETVWAAQVPPASAESQRTGGSEMDTLDEMIEPPMPRTERQRQELRNALARRKLENLREQKVLHRWLTDVWDEAVNA
jgi:hypothetical protein